MLPQYDFLSEVASARQVIWQITLMLIFMLILTSG